MSTMATTDTPTTRTFTPVPASALRTMTWAELWISEDEAVATGDEEGRQAVLAEMERRRLPAAA